MRPSPGLARRALVSMLCVVVGVIAISPIAQAAAPLGSTPSYPLRHSFSMAVGLPGAGKHEPTSCYATSDSKEYLCRIVSGVEETRDNRTFYVAASDVLVKGSDPRYGLNLVDVSGTQYEGCEVLDESTYWCDYASRRHIGRQHYEAGRWVLKVLWSWRKYTQGQAACAFALSGFWEGTARKAFFAMLDNCLNAPMERPS